MLTFEVAGYGIFIGPLPCYEYGNGYISGEFRAVGYTTSSSVGAVA